MPRRALLLLCVLLSSSGILRADDVKKSQEIMKEVAGTAEFLRGVPKAFAIVKAIDVPGRKVTLLLDGEKLAKVWPLIPDAEIKVAGWWGRLGQFKAGDKVWIWFKTDRKKQAVAIAMLADEVSEQDIHGPGLTVVSRTNDSLTLKPTKGANRTIGAAKAEIKLGKGGGSLDGLKAGDHVYVRTTGDQARLILDETAMEVERDRQRAWLRQRWSEEGLPGAVAFAHTFSGELDFMLDHEAMRWGRSLKTGDKVTLTADPPIAAVVKHVQPWRERTQVRLVADGFDQADLQTGQRLHLKMSPPSADVEKAILPPDIDRPRNKAERVEWFLASVYCPCGIDGDGCTGMFYTLASCNPNGCGMPNHVRKLIAEKIDRGLTNRQIFEELRKELGPKLLKPHLLP
jgi:Cu/Ag efflux protein CusF